MTFADRTNSLGPGFLPTRGMSARNDPLTSAREMSVRARSSQPLSIIPPRRPDASAFAHALRITREAGARDVGRGCARPLRRRDENARPSNADQREADERRIDDQRNVERRHSDDALMIHAYISRYFSPVFSRFAIKPRYSLDRFITVFFPFFTRPRRRNHLR